MLFVLLLLLLLLVMKLVMVVMVLLLLLLGMGKEARCRVGRYIAVASNVAAKGTPVSRNGRGGPEARVSNGWGGAHSRGSTKGEEVSPRRGRKSTHWFVMRGRRGPSREALQPTKASFFLSRVGLGHAEF